MDSVDQITTIIECKMWFEINRAINTPVEIIMITIPSENFCSIFCKRRGNCIIG